MYSSEGQAGRLSQREDNPDSQENLPSSLAYTRLSYIDTNIPSGWHQ